MNICNIYDHADIKMNDKNEVQLILGVAGGRDTFQHSSVSYWIQFTYIWCCHTIIILVDNLHETE